MKGMLNFVMLCCGRRVVVVKVRMWRRASRGELRRMLAVVLCSAEGRHENKVCESDSNWK